MRQPLTGVTFQVNVSARDVRFLEAILPHQLRQWAGQVDEFLVVVDAVRDRGSAELAQLRAIVAAALEGHAHARTIDIDYSDAARGAVAAEFYGGKSIPLRDWRGAAVYPYYFGLHAASHDAVVHVDSDMLFGGGSQTWVGEALELLHSADDIVAVGPLPGPPTPSGALRSQTLERYPLPTPAYRAESLSTRVFLAERTKFAATLGPLSDHSPTAQQLLLAWLDGYFRYEAAEDTISRAMSERHLSRVDFLGQGAGMWSLHPAARSDLFYAELPAIVARVEAGDIPQQQRGEHDINDSLIDWSSARRSRASRWFAHTARLRARAGELSASAIDLVRGRGRAA